MSKKKILYIHHGQGIGGAPLSLLYLIQALDKTHYEPVVLFLNYSSVMDLYRSHGIIVVGPVTRSDFAHTDIWWYRWYHVKHLIKALIDSFALMNGEAAAWIEMIKPDVIHLNTSSLVAWGYVAKKMGIPVVWHIREPLARGYFGLRRAVIKKIIGQYANAILPICSNDAKPWKASSKTTVVYNAVPVQLFKAQKEVEIKAPTLLFVGGLSQEKGTLLLFEVFEKLLQKLPQVKLVVAGTFELEQQVAQASFLQRKLPTFLFYQKVAAQLEKIKYSVTFVGVSNKVPELMAQADVLLFPATVGHFARPIIEAGFMAKPVVASKLTPLDELVEDGKTGFLVDPKDSDAWVEKLFELLTDKPLAQHMGQVGFEFATQKFSIEKQIDAVQKVYRSL